MYNNGTMNDIENRVANASRMLTIFGNDFEFKLPLFRN